MRIAPLLFGTAVALAAIAPSVGAQARAAAAARDEAERLRAGVESSAGRMSQAFNRGDIEGLVQVFAPEAWIFPPNAEPFQGRAAANEFFTRGYTDGTRNLQLTTTGFDQSGYLAYETGTYTADYPTPGQRGAMSRDYGKYVHVWKRDASGEWRIHLAAWNSNLPPTPMRR